MHGNKRVDIEVTEFKHRIYWSRRSLSSSGWDRVWVKFGCCGREAWRSSLKMSRLRGSRYCNICIREVHAQRQRDKVKDYLTDGAGYILVHERVYSPDEREILEPMFRYQNCRSRRVPEHRAVVALSLGRSLTEDEVVHHKNHVKDDNRLENLELLSVPAHSHKHIKEASSIRQRHEEILKQLLVWTI